MLVALPQIDKEELVAGLLVFRALYFMTPFGIALLTMACWEATLFFRRGRVDETMPAAEAQTKPEPPPGKAADSNIAARQG